ncbi:HAMP domain-containing histidine kinase [bacterium]|nr:HAMP domain-containing histidine kinase [bacterium]
MKAETTHSAPARWPLVLAVLLLVAALATLLWIRGRLVSEEETSLSNAVRVFERTDALGRPENVSVRFSQVESLARSLEESDLVARLFVTKQALGGRERLLYPYYYELLHPDWRTEVQSWERLPVGDPTSPHGWLYVELAPKNREAVDRAVWVFGLLLFVCLGVLVFRQRGKEVELSRTVSELEQRRAEVIRLERLALAGQLSANIFHDLKKPVLNIKHEVSDALEGSPIDRDELLQAVHTQTELFLKMLRELGFENFVRVSEEESEYCDIAETIDRAMSLVKYERGDVDVQCDVPRDGSLPLVFAPQHRLIQLFSNFFLNAFQAMEGRGSLWVSVNQEDYRLAVVIEDSGPGLPEELREDLFEPFITTRGEQGGSGLGLYICSKILGDLGGDIVIEAPQRDHGARFRMTIPCQTSE